MTSKPKALPVRWLLIAFAVVLLGPVLALAVVVLSQYATSERTRYMEEGRKAAHDIVANLDRELGQAQVATQALATSRMIQSGNYEAFHKQASELLQVLAFGEPDDLSVAR